MKLPHLVREKREDLAKVKVGVASVALLHFQDFEWKEEEEGIFLIPLPNSYLTPFLSLVGCNNGGSFFKGLNVYFLCGRYVVNPLKSLPTCLAFRSVLSLAT